jgi:hypothetical protein
MAITSIHSPFLENNHIAREGDCFSFQFDVSDPGAAHTSLKLVDSESNVYGCVGGDVIGGKVATICIPVKDCFGGAEDYVPNMDIDELSVDVHDVDYNFLGNYNLYPGVTAFQYVGTSTVKYNPELNAGDALVIMILLVFVILNVISLLFKK